MPKQKLTNSERSHRHLPISHSIHAAIQSEQSKGKTITNLSFTDYSSHESLLEKSKIQKAFINIFKYPHYFPTAKGEGEALIAIADYYKKRGEIVDPENLIITSGHHHSMLFLLQLLSRSSKNASSTILIPRPYSPSTIEIADFLGLQLGTFQLDAENDWQVDLTSLKKTIKPHTKAILLGSPHLPTGAIQSQHTLEKIADICRENDLILIIDEFQSDYLYEKNRLPKISALTSAQDKLIVLGLHSLSDCLALPGLKISWIRAHGPDSACQALLQKIEMVADTFLSINQLGQTILPELFKYSRSWQKKLQKSITKNRKILVDILGKHPKIKLNLPAGGIYAMLQIDSILTDEDLAIDLIEQTNTYYHPGAYYGLPATDDQKTSLIVDLFQDTQVLKHSLQKLLKYLSPKQR